MSYLVDSHCHLDLLDLTPFEGSLDRAIEASIQADVKKMLCISVDMEKIPAILKLAEQYPMVYASVGVHPSEDQGEEVDPLRLLDYAKHPKVIAVGETGLDYYYEFTDKSVQRARFITHIEVAQKCNMPLIIHTRKAQEDTIAILRKYEVSQAVFHCFTESIEMARQGLDLGLMISFSGILTFKNADSLREVAKYVPLDRILVETDSPYLTPMPNRGKPNYPGYTRLVAECLANLKGLTYPEVRDQTTRNFHQLFKLGESSCLF
ncbi:MAG: TatD family hydrolase [Gammaproteobacteria bacterium]|nr:TatD family hydrolase [Gammaproteobacteria bacterium]